MFQALLDAAKTHGANKEIITDGDGRKLTYGEIRRAAFALSVPIKKVTKPGDKVGVFLPTGAGAVIAFFAVHAAGRVPAMMNFTAGVKNLKAAARTAPFTKVLTAHKFIEIGGLHGLVDDLKDAMDFVYLEDMREEIGLGGKIKAVLGPSISSVMTPNASPDDPGVILFTSGTEGAPKGVVLTHANLLANVEQIDEHVESLPTDSVFNPLPMFHCYGLTAGSLWPIISGMPVSLHPSPLQTKTVAKRIHSTGSTVLFATDTFLQQYMRASADGGLNALRFAVCGAERVREETRKTAEARFSFEVIEGYGVTEGAPVLAANQPGDIRAGTIGRMLPGIESRIEPVEGLDEDAGCLWVKGPNIMRGYIKPDNPGEIIELEDGWHNTGDVVSVDQEGYYVIRGRIKRFAKIGGEMVSLAVVENCAAAVWPEFMHAAAILPDKRKGEKIILVSENPDAKRHELLAWAQTHGVPEIAVPKKIMSVGALPLLGTGKMDYVSVTQIANEAFGEPKS